MTDKELFEKILDLFNFEVSPFSDMLEEIQLIDKHSKLEVFFYDGKRGDRIVGVKDECDFIRLLGLIKIFGVFLYPQTKKNPFFGCRSKEEIIIKLDLMFDNDNNLWEINI